MNSFIKILFSLFFAIAIGVHIYFVIVPDGKPFWWHCIYYITYAMCWWMLFSKMKHRQFIYTLSAIFPFFSHVYYGYLHLPAMDFMFWICLLVCVMLILGMIYLRSSSSQLSN